MRRELKVPLLAYYLLSTSIRHKAYPDEKGTESPVGVRLILSQIVGHKAYPDEKGTERSLNSIHGA